MRSAMPSRLPPSRSRRISGRRSARSSVVPVSTSMANLGGGAIPDSSCDKCEGGNERGKKTARKNIHYGKMHNYFSFQFSAKKDIMNWNDAQHAHDAYKWSKCADSSLWTNAPIQLGTVAEVLERENVQRVAGGRRQIPGIVCVCFGAMGSRWKVMQISLLKNDFPALKIEMGFGGEEVVWFLLNLMGPDWCPGQIQWIEFECWLLHFDHNQGGKSVIVPAFSPWHETSQKNNKKKKKNFLKRLQSLTNKTSMVRNLGVRPWPPKARRAFKWAGRFSNLFGLGSGTH